MEQGRTRASETRSQTHFFGWELRAFLQRVMLAKPLKEDHALKVKLTAAR